MKTSLKHSGRAHITLFYEASADTPSRHGDRRRRGRRETRSIPNDDPKQTKDTTEFREGLYTVIPTTSNGNPISLTKKERTRLPGTTENVTNENNQPNAYERPRTHEYYVNTAQRDQSTASRISRYIPSRLRTHRHRNRRNNEYDEPMRGRGNHGSAHGLANMKATIRQKSATSTTGIS